MRSRQERRRSRFVVEALEGRIALSGGLAGMDHGHHQRGRDAAEIRHGADDPANHNTAADNLPSHSGLDDAPGHDAADDSLPHPSGKNTASGHH